MSRERQLSAPPPLDRHLVRKVPLLLEFPFLGQRSVSNERVTSLKEDELFVPVADFVTGVRVSQLPSTRSYTDGFYLYRAGVRRGYSRAGQDFPQLNDDDVSRFLTDTFLPADKDHAEYIVELMKGAYSLPTFLSEYISSNQALRQLGNAMRELTQSESGRSELVKRIEIFPQQEPRIARSVGVTDPSLVAGLSDSYHLHEIMKDRLGR